LSNPLDVTLTGCDFLQNHAGTSGGGIYLHDASTVTTITGCLFSEDDADDYGGAIYIDSGPTDVVDCTFTSCWCTEDGGAAYITGAGPVTFLRCGFDLNTAASGGGIAAYALPALSLQDCTFESNGATHFGGGLLCDNLGLLSVNRCDFLTNTAQHGDGGGIFTDSTTTAVDSCLFQGNHAGEPHGGGGMWASAGDDDITNCLFWENTGYRGGSLRLYDCVADTIRSCTFSDNQAELSGGGARVGGGAYFFHNCSFTRNGAVNAGGIYCANATLDVMGGIFYGNIAKEGVISPTCMGGGIHSPGNSDISITGSLFANDSAAAGGCLAMRGYGTLDMRSTSIYACHALREECASGLYLDDDIQGTAERTIISYGTQGEAVHCAPDLLTLTCCDLYGNVDGDWTGSIAGQYGVDGNISEDPLFCDPSGGAPDYDFGYYFGLHSDSPCAPFSDPNPECDLIGAFVVACGPASAEDPASPIGPTLLLRHSPNPVHRAARITYTVPYALGAPTANVHLAIYDASGRLVRCLVDEEQVVGIHGVSWDGTDSGHQTTSSGVYFCRLQVGSASMVQSVIRIE
ncbi:MAG: hypothetical protein KAY32_17330, partial [Candidatus Eisenbacteria sp.]|nr:hypothetical protein [Candidatus Eisenbacteria bacterium]